LDERRRGLRRRTVLDGHHLVEDAHSYFALDFVCDGGYVVAVLKLELLVV
jgi:hypothetical protein